MEDVARAREDAAVVIYLDAATGRVGEETGADGEEHGGDETVALDCGMVMAPTGTIHPRASVHRERGRERHHG